MNTCTIPPKAQPSISAFDNRKITGEMYTGAISGNFSNISRPPPPPQVPNGTDQQFLLDFEMKLDLPFFSN